jgi:hypothetical protein
VLRRGHSTTRYLVIHGDEETAREVLAGHMRTHPGTAYIVAGHERNVAIASGRLDPNRMFSREGAEKSLRRLNPGWEAEQLRAALDLLDRGRERLAGALTPPPGGLLFALHNNSSGYSVRDEEALSDQVSLADPEHPHEFFLCTGLEDYARLSLGPHNVVLQRYAPPEDDGSFSRLAARRGLRYVNLEVGLGKAQVQREMLEWAVARLT